MASHLGEKYGGRPRGRSADDAHVRARRRQADDLVFDLDAAVRANTFDAHRLCALAHEMGGPALQGAAVERFLSAHFAEGLALDDHEVLQRLSAESGMDERRVAAVLAADSYADRVRDDEQRARSMGVTATPFILANGYAALTGPHPTADYLALLRGVVARARVTLAGARRGLRPNLTERHPAGSAVSPKDAGRRALHTTRSGVGGA